MLIYNTWIKVMPLLSLMFLILVPSALGSSFGKGDEIIVTKSTIPVQLDGIWSTKTEWADASEAKIVENGLTAYLKAKYDERFLYVLIDFVSDMTLNTGNWGVVCFDTRNDGGKAPLPDDYCFYRTIRGAGIKGGDSFASGIMQGNGMKWVSIEESKSLPEFKAVMSHSQLNDPYESKDHHVSYEFKIPRGKGLGEEMRFYVYVNDGYYNNFVEWPTNAGGKRFAIGSPTLKDVLASPNNWGILHLKH